MSEKKLDRHNSSDKHPFRVPEGYFSEKKKSLYLIAAKETTPKVIPLWKQTYVWSSGIAALLAIALFFYFQETTPSIDPNLPVGAEVSLNNLSADEIEAYLLNGYQYSTDEDLIHSELDVLDFQEEELNL